MSRVCKILVGKVGVRQRFGAVRETHTPLNELAQATPKAHPKEHLELLETLPSLIIDDLGMRQLPLTAAEKLSAIIMRRDERAGTLPATNFLL
jgi:DNA replication protein DnaC